MLILKTPMRCTLVGGGSDNPIYFENYPPGAVINFAINKYNFIILKKRSDFFIYLKYAKNEIVHISEVDKIQNKLFREVLKYAGIDFGLEIVCLSDISQQSGGFGLATSSCLVISLLHALWLLKNVIFNKNDLVTEAFYIERTLCETNVGLQDFCGPVYGGLNLFVFNSKERKRINPLITEEHKLLDFANNFLLFFTGTTKDSADVLSKQEHNIITDPQVVARMRKNTDLAFALEKEIKRNNWCVIGDYLNQNWQLKKGYTNNVTNDYIDKIYQTAITAGAGGGKLVGSGGGGFMLFYVEHHKREKVKKVLQESFPLVKHMPFKIDNYGTRVLSNVEEYTW